MLYTGLFFHIFTLLSMALVLRLLHSLAAAISRSLVSMEMTMICRSSTVKYFNVLSNGDQSHATSGSAKKNMALVLTFPPYFLNQVFPMENSDGLS